MLVLVTGATGYVGRTVVPALRDRGHRCAKLAAAQLTKLGWSPVHTKLDEFIADQVGP